MSEPAQDVQPEKTATPSRWESLVWPKWLPIRARLPLLAQISGVAALIAAVAMPTWPDAPPPALQAAVAPLTEYPTATPLTPEPAARLAHLNLDIRHNFRSVNVTVTIDDKREFDSKLEGSGKKFGVFGKREERGYTKTFDLEPGVRVVRVRVHSPADKFDQTRVERFELGSASVASLRLVVERSGLAVFADRPAIAPTPPPVAPRQASVLAVASAPAAPAPAVPPRGVLLELYLTLRSVLIATAGFVATTAAGFVVQEFLISRKRLLGL